MCVLIILENSLLTCHLGIASLPLGGGYPTENAQHRLSAEGDGERNKDVYI